MNERQFYESKVWGIKEKDFFKLIAKLNEFYKNKFIVATQVFPINNEFNSIVYYKEKERADKVAVISSTRTEGEYRLMVTEDGSHFDNVMIGRMKEVEAIAQSFQKLGYRLERPEEQKKLK